MCNCNQVKRWSKENQKDYIAELKVFLTVSACCEMEAERVANHFIDSEIDDLEVVNIELA